MMNNLLDIYTDYLISSFAQTSRAGWYQMLDGEISFENLLVCYLNLIIHLAHYGF